MKALVVEDNVALCEEYLRIFDRLLSDLDLELICTHTLKEALPKLADDGPWGALIVDYDPGPPATHHEETEEGTRIASGPDLVRFVRKLEEERGQGQVPILGISSNHVAGLALVDAGASSYALKIDMPTMAVFIRAAYLTKTA